MRLITRLLSKVYKKMQIAYDESRYYNIGALGTNSRICSACDISPPPECLYWKSLSYRVKMFVVDNKRKNYDWGLRPFWTASILHQWEPYYR